MSTEPTWRRRLGSVRVRITVATTLLFAVALALASLLVVRAVHNSIEDRIRHADWEAITTVKLRLLEGVAVQNVAMPTSVDFYVLGSDGDLLATSQGLAYRRPSVRLVRGRVAVGHLPNQGTPIFVADVVTTNAGRLTLVAARPVEEVNRSVHAVVGVFLLGIPSLVALFAVVAWLVVGRALRPVDAIRSEVAAISASSMHRRVPEPGTGDEVDRLARTMNSMLERLETAAERQRQFVSDASHELRSPVASIRTTLEVALRKDRANWPGIARSVLADDARMEQLVDELLELAQLEETADAAPDTLVDLDDVVLEEAARVEGNATVRTDHVSAGRVRGRRSQLERVVRNLLDNAARHARSTVAVSLQASDGRVELVVDDDGPGVPDADRERIFERFTRLEEARTRDAGGVGLGLPLARAIVERHGGTITVATSEQLGGARFVVRLPASDTGTP